MLKSIRAVGVAVCFVLFCAVLSFGPASAQTEQAVAEKGVSYKITSEGLKKIMAEETPIYMVDVRQKSEYDAGHIAGAHLVPLNELPAQYESIPRTGKVVVYCRSGRRSALAVDFLKQKGYANVYNLEGGYVGWQETEGQRK